MSHNKLNFCTLFNSHYLSRGLALYESLAKCCDNFHLYIFAFDQKAYDIIKKMAPDNVTLVHLNDLEDEELLGVKHSRTPAEYCWTCTPAVVDHCLSKFGLESCTYLDADLYFYSCPADLFNETADMSVIITEHRYTPKYDRTVESGIYCVQFVYFKNDARGLEVLKQWRANCIDWCFARHEDNKFGDQKYLDEWPEKYRGVHVLKNHGGGLAPWNVQRYEITDDGGIGIREVKSRASYKLVFYHFHDVRFFKSGKIRFGGYDLSNVTGVLYKPYIKHLETLKRKIGDIDGSFDPHGAGSSGVIDMIKTVKYYFTNPEVIKNTYYLDGFTHEER